MGIALKRQKEGVGDWLRKRFRNIKDFVTRIISNIPGVLKAIIKMIKAGDVFGLRSKLVSLIPTVGPIINTVIDLIIKAEENGLIDDVVDLLKALLQKQISVETFVERLKSMINKGRKILTEGAGCKSMKEGGHKKHLLHMVDVPSVKRPRKPHFDPRDLIPSEVRHKTTLNPKDLLPPDHRPKPMLQPGFKPDMFAKKTAALDFDAGDYASEEEANEDVETSIFGSNIN